MRVIVAQFRRPVQAGRRIEWAGPEPSDHSERCERARDRVHTRVIACTRARGGGVGGGGRLRWRHTLCGGGAGLAATRREGCRCVMQVKLEHALPTNQPELTHRAGAGAHEGRHPSSWPCQWAAQALLPPRLRPQYMRPPGRRAASRRGNASERSLSGLGQSRAGPAPHRPAPHRPAPHRPAPHMPAPHMPAPHRPAPSMRCRPISLN